MTATVVESPADVALARMSSLVMDDGKPWAESAHRWQVDDAMSRLYIERMVSTGFLPAPDSPMADVTDTPRDRDN